MVPTIRQRHTTLLAISLVLAVAVTAACSNGTGSGDATGNASQHSGSSTTGASKGSLTVAVASAVVEYSPIYLAQSLGYFADEGVNVKIIDNTGPLATNYVVSGEADLEFYSPAQEILTRSKGENLKIIYSSGDFEGSALVGGKGIDSLAKLQSLSTCRVATTPAGTASYAMAKQFISTLGLHCTQVTSSTSATLSAGVASGEYQAVVFLYPAAVATVAAGQATLLIDPTTTAFQAKYNATHFPEFTAAGLGSNLASKRDAVEAFLKALNKAAAYIKNTPRTDVATTLHSVKEFAGTPVATLEQGLKSFTPFLPSPPVPGIITPSTWSLAVDQALEEGVAGLSKTVPAAQFGQIVDMSYANAAASS